MCKRMVCIMVALLCLIPSFSYAGELKEAVSALSDDAILHLYSVVAVEMYHRGLSEEEIAECVAAYYRLSQNQGKAELSSNPPDAFYIVLDGLKHLSKTQVTETSRSTPKPTFAPLVQLEDDDIVWISNTGKRYHTTPDCSGMSNPSDVTLETALSRGLTPCRDCAYWLAEMGDD